MVKISFVLHGKIRGRNHLLNKLKSVFNQGFDLHFFETQKARHAEDLALEALTDGCDFLIAIGGDGTLSEVVNAYLRGGGKAHFQTVIGALPWGTGNDFVRTIGVEKSVEQMKQLIVQRSVVQLDAGEIIHPAAESSPAGRYFDNIADIGIGAEVVARVNGVHLRKAILGGTMIFFLTALRTFFMYRHKQVSVIADGYTWSGKLLSLVVANGRFFGSGLGVAPDAKVDDGLFQVVLFGDLSVWDYLRNYARLRQSKRLHLAEVTYIEAKEVQVQTEVAGVVVEADGEVVGKAPVRFVCRPGVLPFLCPKS